MENRIVYQFARGATESICCSLKEFKQRQYIDLRIFFKNENGNDWFPTKKGITLGFQLLPELKKAIETLETEIMSEKAKEKGSSSLQKVSKSV